MKIIKIKKEFEEGVHVFYFNYKELKSIFVFKCHEEDVCFIRIKFKDESKIEGSILEFDENKFNDFISYNCISGRFDINLFEDEALIPDLEEKEYTHFYPNPS